MGAKVTVLTGAPNFPDGRVYDGYKNKAYQEHAFDGIKVLRVWTYIAKNKGFLKRSIDQFSFACTSFVAGSFQNFDVIIATSPSFFTTWSAYFLSKIKNKPWVFELRDIWPKSISSLNMLNGGLLLRTLERIEKKLYKDCDMIVPVTHSFKRYLINLGIDKSKIHVITNGVNLDFFKKGNKDNSLIKELRLDDKFVIGYFGTIGLSHSMKFVVKTISNLIDDNVFLIIAGSGAKKEEIINYINNKNFKNIIVLPTLKKNELLKYMRLIDTAIVPLKRIAAFKEVIPSKIFEAAALEKPIILGVEGESKEIIKKYNAGICYIPENAKSLLSSIRLLIYDSKNLVEYKSGCNKLAADFDRKKLSKIMYQKLKELV